MRVVTVARRPLDRETPTVAQNVLKHGCGAINIDASRITTSENLNGGAYAEQAQSRHDGAENWRYKRGDADGGGLAGQAFKQPTGRWPANLILVHLPGCVNTGEMHTVESNGHFPTSRGPGSQTSGPSGHTGQDALIERHTRGEAVAVWACAPGCPVAGLDTQSGITKSAVALEVKTSRVKGQFVANAMSIPGVNQHGDTGGASRFFKQVGGRMRAP